MLPITQIPDSILTGLQTYRNLFCRDAGFEHIGRDLTGLITSPHQTLPGIHDLPVWPDDQHVSSRAMHEAVVEAGWQSHNLMPQHRKWVGVKYKGKGRHTLAVDWTYSHHARGPEIYGVKKGFDYAKGGYGLFQTVLTVTVANAKRQDGIEVPVQQPAQLPKETAYLKATTRPHDDTLEAARERRLELLHDEVHRQSYRQITEMAVDAVRQMEEEGPFPSADYAFDNGVLNRDLTRLIEPHGKHWTSEREASRQINWKGVWHRIDEVASELKQRHPQSFRRIEFSTRSGEAKTGWGFSKVLRLKRYGNKRILIVPEPEDLSDKPRFLITSALHGEAKRLRTSWSYRWPCELFHEFSKPSAGLEAAKNRQEEAVKRHFRLSGVAQTLLPDLTLPTSTSGKFDLAPGQVTPGQRQRKIIREVLSGLLALAQPAFRSGKTPTELLEALMPA